MGYDCPLLASGPGSATRNDGSGQIFTQMVSISSSCIEPVSLHASFSYLLSAADLYLSPLDIAQRAGITDIPVKVFIDRILPFCESRDVLSLGHTNKLLALVAADENFWRGRLAIDYNFTGWETNRTSDWKLIYQRINKAQLFTWGCVLFSFCYGYLSIR